MTQSISRSTRPKSLGLDRLEGALPQVEHPGDQRRLELAAVDEVAGPVEVLLLDVERAGLAAVGQPDLAAAGRCRGEISRIARIGFSIVRSRITTPSSIIRSTRSQVATLSMRGGLAHVRVADDHVQPAVALGVGVRLVAGVDDRAGCGWWRC